jgi:Ssp1 endopeptidase immunity protein Rap1a
MQRQVMWVLLIVMVLMPALGGAVTEADFEAKTTQNLLNLCNAASSDPRYREAIHFCHGYLVGAYHYHVAQTEGEGGKSLVCFPTPPPSRNEALRMFLAWAQAHPQYMNERPVETEFRFLTEKWPCQK